MGRYIYISLICIALIGCQYSKPVKQSTTSKDVVTDTIFKNLHTIWTAEQENKLDFVEWLNDNGGYILAFKYLKDSIKNHPTNDIALKGADIAFQHGYLEQSLSFLRYYKPATKRDSVLKLFNEHRVYLSQLHTWEENRLLTGIEKHLTYIKSDSQLYFQYLSDMGMHFHNTGKYDTAIQLNTLAYNWAKRNNYGHSIIANCCQRLGNDYNDLVRKNLLHPKDRRKVYNKAAALYDECLEELTQINPQPKERIANCYFTYAFLIRVGNYKMYNVEYYEKALNIIVPNTLTLIGKREPIFCLNPLLASIIYTHLGECSNNDYKNTRKVEYADKCLKYSSEYCYYFNQLLTDPDYQGVLNDILSTYSQRNTEQLINYIYDCTPTQKVDKYKLLTLSNSCKYALLNKQHAMAQSPSLSLQLSDITMLRSLEFMAYSTGNKRLIDLSDQARKKIQTDKSSLIYLPPALDSNYINNLHKTCKDENIAIIDFCIANGNLLTTFIDKDSVVTKYQPAINTIFGHAGQINEAAIANNPKAYDSLSYCLYRFLFSNYLDGKHYKKVIIVPTPDLQSTSFDGLTTTRTNSEQWGNLDYLGNHFVTQIVPRIDWVLDNKIRTPDQFKLYYNQVDFRGNNSLPYSDELKSDLVKRYGATLINSEQMTQNKIAINGILHIATHTNIDTIGSVNLILDKYSISPIKDKPTQCKMVVLNTCDASKGVNYTNEGKISLARLFVAQGADAVITSNGKVDNHASTELFKRFYYNLSKGKSVSESLQLSKVEVSKMTPEWANPIFWSQYQLWGKDLLFIIN